MTVLAGFGHSVGQLDLAPAPRQLHPSAPALAAQLAVAATAPTVQARSTLTT